MKPLVRIVPALAFGLVLAACGSDFSGEYIDEMGVTRYQFDGDGRVYMSVMGIETAGEYEVDEERVVLRGPQGSMVLKRDGDALLGPMGLKLTREEGEPQ